MRSARSKGFDRKPRLRRHTVTLYAHFVRLEAYHQAHFHHAAVLTGSGAPKGLMIPFHGTRLIRRRLRNDWRLWLEVMLVKERPRIVGMDANYVAGFVFSDGQHVGQNVHARIQTSGKRRRHTFDLTGKALRQVDWSRIDALVLETLRHVKTGDVLSPIQQAPVPLALQGL